MAKRVISGTVLEEAAKIKQVWIENPSFAIPQPTPEAPTITQAGHAAKAAALQAKEAAIDALRTQLTGMIEERDGLSTDLNGWNVRLRRGIGFVYGLESPQYKQVGGTPPSERKARTVKAKPTTP
jgi:hypothetical protein